MPFERRLFAGWGDMDFNSHMRNTSFLDKSGDVRMLFFIDSGFSMEDFLRLRIGPVIMKDEMEYFREVQLMEELRITLSLAGIAEDGTRFRLRNEFYRGDGKLAAKITSTGGWLDLSTRKLVLPPEALATAMKALDRTDDYQSLASSVK